MGELDGRRYEIFYTIEGQTQQQSIITISDPNATQDLLEYDLKQWLRKFAPKSILKQIDYIRSL